MLKQSKQNSSRKPFSFSIVNNSSIRVECPSVIPQQKIDFDRELIMLSNTDLTEVRDLPKRIPKDAARYHFFLYKHSHEGDHQESIGEHLYYVIARNGISG